VDSTQSPIPAAGDAALDIDDVPAGNHALEVAARRGFGPLSAAARRIWHGDATPCVTCGQLVRREDDQCDHCSQDLREEMLEKMRAHAGPWFVLEHLRPFPGVSLDRIIRQIRRGLITETSIVRGPATQYHWRFAVETPGLCRYFNRCWHCHHEVKPAETYCAACLSNLAFETPRANVAPPLVGGAAAPADASPRPAPTVAPPLLGAAAVGRPSPRVPAPAAVSSELEKLATAVRKLDHIPPAPDWDAPARIGPFRASWLAAAILITATIILLIIIQSRTRSTPSAPPATSAAAPLPAAPPQTP